MENRGKARQGEEEGDHGSDLGSECRRRGSGTGACAWSAEEAEEMMGDKILLFLPSMGVRFELQSRPCVLSLCVGVYKDRR
jgi:hypothetical protein